MVVNEKTVRLDVQSESKLYARQTPKKYIREILTTAQFVYHQVIMNWVLATLPPSKHLEPNLGSQT